MLALGLGTSGGSRGVCVSGQPPNIRQSGLSNTGTIHRLVQAFAALANGLEMHKRLMNFFR